MIEAHEEFAIVPDFTSQRIFNDNEEIIELLKDIRVLAEKGIRSEVPQPSIFPFIATSNPSTAQIVGNTTRLHTTHLVISISAAGFVTLNIGSVAAFTFNFGAADTKEFNFPIVIEPGKDVSIIANAGSVFGHFVGYTESH